MKRAILLCILSLGLLGGSSVLAGPARIPKEIWNEVIHFPATPSPDYHRRICKNTFEIKGVLDTQNMPEQRRPIPPISFDILLRGLDGTIRVDDKTYHLDFGTDATLRAQARRLNGKRVVLRGRAESREMTMCCPLTVEKQSTNVLHYFVVTSLQDADEFVRETVNVDIQGRFQVDVMLGFDGSSGPVVHVNGQMYVLDLSIFGRGWRQRVAGLDGMTVRLTARRGEMQTYVGPMDPKVKGPRQFRTLHVQSIELANDSFVTQGAKIQIQGEVRLYRHIRFGRGAVGITVAGQTYWLDAGANDALYRDITSQAGQIVLITGQFRRSDRAIEVAEFAIALPAQHYRETTTVEIKGFLQEAPRVGGLMELAIYPPRRTLQVNVNGRALTLDLARIPGLYVRTYEMVGASVIVRGTLEGNVVRATDVQRVGSSRMMPLEAVAR